MSKQMDGIPWDRLPGREVNPKRHKNQKYPWEEWFNGKTHLLLHGEDWPRHIPRQQFKTYIYRTAGRKGVKVKITPVKGGHLYIRKIGSLRYKNRPRDPVIEAVLRGDPIPTRTNDEDQGRRADPLDPPPDR